MLINGEECNAIYIAMQEQTGNARMDGANIYSRPYTIGYAGNLKKRMNGYNTHQPQTVKLRYAMYFRVNRTEIHRLEKNLHNEIQGWFNPISGNEWYEFQNIHMAKALLQHLPSKYPSIYVGDEDFYRYD